LKVSKDPDRPWMTNEMGFLAFYILFFIVIAIAYQPPGWSSRFLLVIGLISIMPFFLAYVELTRASALEISDSGIRVETRTIGRTYPLDASLLIDIVLDQEDPQMRPMKGLFIRSSRRFNPLVITPKKGWRPGDVRAIYEALLPLIDGHGLRTTLLFNEFRSNHRGYVLYRGGGRSDPSGPAD
jgi:hypothetical protein